MSERIRGALRNALYKWTYTFLYFFTKTITASIIGSRLDYCNSLLYGVSQANIDRLQRVQNVLARVVAQAPGTNLTKSSATCYVNGVLLWFYIWSLFTMRALGPLDNPAIK